MNLKKITFCQFKSLIHIVTNYIRRVLIFNLTWKVCETLACLPAKMTGVIKKQNGNNDLEL